MKPAWITFLRGTTRHPRAASRAWTPKIIRQCSISLIRSPGMADPNTYRLTAEEIANALPVGGAAPAIGSTANRVHPVACPLKSILKTIWDKGTFGNARKSIEYHLRKHDQGLTEVEYTQRAIRAFKDTTAVRARVSDIRRRAVFKVVSKEGTGLFTKTGRIIWFHPNL